MLSRLASKTALITGTSSGLGRAIALAFAREGANICCVDLQPTPQHPNPNPNPINTSTTEDHPNDLKKIQNQHQQQEQNQEQNSTLSLLLHHLAGHSQNAIFIKADMTISSEVENAIAQCVKRFGRLDILVNNAGICIENNISRGPRKLHETDEAEFEKTMAVNVKSIFLGCKFGLRQMLAQQQQQQENSPPPPSSPHPPSHSPKPKSHIINISSIQGLVPYHFTPSYCASKGAAIMLTKQIALDYAPLGIHCNAICPGFLNTTMTGNVQRDEGALGEVRRRQVLWRGGGDSGGEGGVGGEEAGEGGGSIEGLGNPADVALAAVFLASDDVRWITGIALPVDGGYLLR
ncbi:MAG: hypothetical protein M1834_002440 [Cirrosporium novae-zelandiae]|nr:MAG: hypothetical protein M1834_002440 [Cirrosporium novae-zelandiae]